MSVTPGFRDLYPDNEPAKARERARLEGFDVDGLVLGLAHAVETGEYLTAAAAEEPLAETVKTAEEYFSEYTIPD